MFDKCSKNLNTSYLLKRPRQTGQTQIRLLLMKQSDQVFPVCCSTKHFVNPSPDNQNFYLRTERVKCLKILENYHRVLHAISSNFLI